MHKICDSIIETVGNTPVVRINRLAPDHVELFVKVEAFNPLGSVKDRLAVALLEAAERDGQLSPGQTVIEATSGNTGIGLAMACAAKGYPLVIVMAENFSLERRKLLRFLGARVVLTPAWAKGTGMLAAARHLAEANGWFLCRQFETEVNADVHSATTAQEILAAFPDGSLDYFVTGFGTGGTLKGISRVLRARSPKTKVIACEPDNSPVMQSGIPQEFDSEGRALGSHPKFRPHLMQGWAPDFLPKLANDALAAGAIDEITGVRGDDAVAAARELAVREGIFCGISSGATFAAALEVAEKAPPGSRILAMLPDTGERYLSTVLFEGIYTSMNAEEQAIADTFPSFAPPPPAPETEVPVVPAASAFIDEVLSDASQPLVMFALEWCEFCWSLRRLFAAAGIPYRSVDLDSAEFQTRHDADAVRAALKVRAGAPTIPQVFLDGHQLGGCNEVLALFASGELHNRLDAVGVKVDRETEIDPFAFLPAWARAA
jgi:cysteine synthase A